MKNLNPLLTIKISEGVEVIDHLTYAKKTDMMKSLILFVVLLPSYGLFAQSLDHELQRSPNLITIPLTTYVGAGKVATVSRFFKKTKISKEELSDKNTVGYIYSYDYQPILRSYRAYLSGRINKEQFSQLFNYYGSDSIDLTSSIINSEISIKVIFGKDGFTTLTADQNNNDEFNDDIIYRLPTRKKSKDSFKSYEDFPPVFKFENIMFFAKGKTLSKSDFIRIEPYHDFNKGVDLDSISHDNIFFRDFEYKLGKISIDSSSYFVYLNSPVFEIKQVYSKTKLLFTEAEKMLPVNYQYLNRKLGDTVWMDSHVFIPLHFTENGDSLVVRVEKSDNNFFSFSQGAQIPNFRAKSVTGKSIDIYNYKASGYLLLDFFGSWCMPCIENFPKLKKLNTKFSKYGFKIAGIAYETDSNFVALKKLLAKERVGWDVIVQSRPGSYELIEKARVHSFPTYMLISPTNKIIFTCSGDELDEVERILERELIMKK